MGLLMLASFAGMFIVGFPTLTFFYAKDLKRDPWKWFFIGLLLPGIATVILACLPEVKEESPKS